MPKQEVYPPFEHRYAAAGCWITLVVIPAVGWLIAPWLAFLLAVPLAMLVQDQGEQWRAVAETRRLRAQGVRGLLIYSRSPKWQPYIEEHWLPRIAGRMDVLDWSDRRHWQKDDRRVRLFNRLIGSCDYKNPAAVIFRATGQPLTFQFYPAFQNAKHGNMEGLRMLEEEFFRALEE